LPAEFFFSTCFLGAFDVRWVMGRASGICTGTSVGKEIKVNGILAERVLEMHR